MTNLLTKLLVVIIIAGHAVQSEATYKMSFNFNIHKLQESGAECVLNLARRFFPPASIISIMSSGLKRDLNGLTGISTDQVILGKIMKEQTWTIMTKTATGRQDGITHNNRELNDDLMFSEKVHAYILFVRTYKDLAAILPFLTNTSSWNPHANFILYMDAGIERTPEDPILVSFLNLAWKYLVINLIVIVANNEKTYQHIITWFPFDEGNCGKQQTKMHVLGICEASALIPNDTNYFPEKVPMNLNKCVIKVGTLVWPPYILEPSRHINENFSKILYNFNNGIEIEIIKAIAKFSNFTIEFKSFEEPENWGTLEDNGTGLIGMLMRQEIDIAIATFTPTKAYHTRFDFSIQYAQDKTTWLVPSPDLIPPWKSLVAIFQPSAWIVSGFIYVMVSIITYLLGSSTNHYLEHQKFRHPNGTFLVIWRMMCGSGTPTFPKNTKIKCFLFLWLLYCMHWSAAYTTYLISMLTTPIYHEQMTSFNDIMDAKMEYGMQLSTTRYFQKNEFIINQIDDFMMQNYKLCHSAAKCLERIATKRDFAMAISRAYFEFVERKYKDQFGNPLIKAFRDDIVTSPVEMLLVKGHPLLSRIDGILLQIIQAGLIDNWTKQIKQDISLQLNIETTIKLESSKNLSMNKALTFYHLQGAFMALGFGLFIACIQFLLEKLVYNCNAK